MHEEAPAAPWEKRRNWCKNHHTTRKRNRHLLVCFVCLFACLLAYLICIHGHLCGRQAVQAQQAPHYCSSAHEWINESVDVKSSRVCCCGCANVAPHNTKDVERNRRIKSIAKSQAISRAPKPHRVLFHSRSSAVASSPQVRLSPSSSLTQQQERCKTTRRRPMGTRPTAQSRAKSCMFLICCVAHMQSSSLLMFSVVLVYFSSRIQDLSIKSSSTSSASPSAAQEIEVDMSTLPPSPPPAEPHSSDNNNRNERGVLTTESSPLKRKNKRASLSPTAKKKTSLSDVVIAEGELVVAEERAQPDRDIVLRTLGSVSCYHSKMGGCAGSM